MADARWWTPWPKARALPGRSPHSLRTGSIYGRETVLQRIEHHEADPADLPVLQDDGYVRLALAAADEDRQAARARRRAGPREVQESGELYGPARRQGDVQEHALPEAV